MRNLMTLPPVKNVDTDQLNGLKGRVPTATVALLVRTGIALMAEMPTDELMTALNNQVAMESEAQAADAVSAAMQATSKPKAGPASVTKKVNKRAKAAGKRDGD